MIIMPVPIGIDQPDGCESRPGPEVPGESWAMRSSHNPNLATTKPRLTMAMLVRTQARKVRSLARCSVAFLSSGTWLGGDGGDWAALREELDLEKSRAGSAVICHGAGIVLPGVRASTSSSQPDATQARMANGLCGIASLPGCPPGCLTSFS